MLANGSAGVELYRNANFTVFMNRIASSSVCKSFVTVSHREAR